VVRVGFLMRHVVLGLKCVVLRCHPGDKGLAIGLVTTVVPPYLYRCWSLLVDAMFA
jgi:hypothetical protein